MGIQPKSPCTSNSNSSSQCSSSKCSSSKCSRHSGSCTLKGSRGSHPQTITTKSQTCRDLSQTQCYQAPLCKAKTVCSTCKSAASSFPSVHQMANSCFRCNKATT